MKEIRLFLVLVVTGFLLGCQQNGVSTDASDDPEPVKSGNFTFYTSESMYDELQGKRPDNAGIPFEITDIWSTKEAGKMYLHVEVQHEKACDEQFEVIWDGRVAESYPLQIFFFVRLDAEDCQDLNDFTTDTLTLDLYELVSPDNNPSVDEAVFTVSNASSNQDISYDEPVSDNG